MTENIRCPWVADVAEYRAYHDDEWGYPVDDDQRLFEKMSLESFQSGLSWRTILNKRDGFRAAFAEFDPTKVARYGAPEVERLLQDASIVRHRGKIEATIHNANVVADMQDAYGSLAAFVWQYEPDPSERPAQMTWEVLRRLSKTRASEGLAKDLKKRFGWRFFGPTTAYAFMQAMGLVNDHTEDCFCRQKAERARKKFTPPR